MSGGTLTIDPLGCLLLCGLLAALYLATRAAERRHRTGDPNGEPADWRERLAAWEQRERERSEA